ARRANHGDRARTGQQIAHRAVLVALVILRLCHVQISWPSRAHANQNRPAPVSIAVSRAGNAPPARTCGTDVTASLDTTQTASPRWRKIAMARMTSHRETPGRWRRGA